MSADTTYFLQETKSSTKTPAIDKGVNALNLVLQTLPMFSKSNWPHLLTQPQSKLFAAKLSLIFITWYFKKGINRRVNRLLKGAKFFEILFSPQYCQIQPSKGTLRKSCSALVFKNREQYVLRTLLFKY